MTPTASSNGRSQSSSVSTTSNGYFLLHDDVVLIESLPSVFSSSHYYFTFDLFLVVRMEGIEKRSCRWLFDKTRLQQQGKCLPSITEFAWNRHRLRPPPGQEPPTSSNDISNRKRKARFVNEEEESATSTTTTGIRKSMAPTRPRKQQRRFLRRDVVEDKKDSIVASPGLQRSFARMQVGGGEQTEHFKALCHSGGLMLNGLIYQMNKRTYAP